MNLASTWDLTYLLIHVAALVCAFLLLREAPDWIQKLIIGLMIAAAVVYIASDIVVLSGERRAWVVRVMASRVEHTAVLLYLFRQVWIRTGTCQYLKSSR